MVYQKRNVAYFAKILAEKHNVPEKKVKALLYYGIRNMMNMIERGEDIYIPGFGHIYSDKKAFKERLDKFQTEQEQRNKKNNE